MIGTNKKDATETVELLLEDAATAGSRRRDATAAAVDALLAERGVRVVDVRRLAAIDEAERAAGEKLGRPRVKLCTWDELLAAAERVASGVRLFPRSGEHRAHLPARRWTGRGSPRRRMPPAAARPVSPGATASSTSSRPSARSAATSAGRPCSR